MNVNQKLASEASMNEIASFEVEKCPFNVQEIFDFYDRFEETKWSFKALFELIGTSNSDNFQHDSNIRLGLQNLLELCLEKHEESVETLRQIALNSPEYSLERARNISGKVCDGTIGNPAGSRDVREALGEVDTVMSLFGRDRYPEAGVIRDRILSKMNVE